MSGQRWTYQQESACTSLREHGRWVASIMHPDHAFLLAHILNQFDAEIALLRRVLSEYLAGNRIVDEIWYSPERAEDSGIPVRLRGYLSDPDTLADDIYSQIHQHCGSDDSCSDKHNDWVSDLTGQIMKLLGLGDDDLTPAPEHLEPHNINQPATPDELALIETLRTEAGP